jgi:hypothetical protein
MGRPLSFMDAVAKPPTLVGSQTLTAASSVLSVDDIIWVLKVLLFFAVVTMVVCTIYRVSLWRSIASAFPNPDNRVPSSSPGTNQPPGMKPITILSYFLFPCFVSRFCCASKPVIVFRISSAWQLPLLVASSFHNKPTISIPTCLHIQDHIVQKFFSFVRFATLRFMLPSGVLWYP